MSTVRIDVRRSLVRTIALVQARGPKGADGTHGQGSQILYGNGAPSLSTGSNQDTYIDRLTGDFYRKELGEWGAPVSNMRFQGWIPVFGAEVDGFRRIFRLHDWSGGHGTKPAITGNGGAPLYLTPAGWSTDKAAAVDYIGPQGHTGWTPILDVHTDGDRRVLHLMDWQGGSGPKPDLGIGPGTPVYVAASGYTTDVAQAVDIRGSAGLIGWSPVFAIQSDGLRRVLLLADWVGGTGPKPAILSGGNPQYLGATGLTTNLANAIDVRGPQGEPGWTPVLTIASDGNRRVQKLSDWVGGGGIKPAITSGSNALYVGPDGWVTNIALAVDLRGPQGIQGDNTTAAQVTFSPTAEVAAGTVQAAIEELSAEKARKDETTQAIATAKEEAVAIADSASIVNTLIFG
jgi:hypothetical protein